MHALALVAVAAIAAGFGAAGAIAVRLLEEREFSNGAVPGQAPSGSLRANLAYLDGHMIGHPARGT